METEKDRRQERRCARCGRRDVPVVYLADGETYCSRCDTYIQVFSPSRVPVAGNRDDDLRTHD
jgi:recombinational DNA repair protein (RecF pathway)